MYIVVYTFVIYYVGITRIIKSKYDLIKLVFLLRIYRVTEQNRMR